ncbi:MAG: hypothetical protein HFG70_07775 [Hungatella sp.]|nr:hypothetical protein [Hungatella sp.]MCI9531074.1 hypothetical protein [Lachnospiraceae bacterium]
MFIRKKFPLGMHTNAMPRKSEIQMTITGAGKAEEDLVKEIARKAAARIARISGKRVRCSVKTL